MPSVEIWKVVVSLGVPGLALFVFYLLMRGFGFSFAQIGGTLAAVVAIVFILVLGFIVYFALDKYAPTPGPAPSVRHFGPLETLQAGILASSAAKVSLVFSPDSADSVRRLYVEDTRAANYSELIDKICSTYACLSCSKTDTTTVTVGLKDGQCIREIRREEGVPIYGCAPKC